MVSTDADESNEDFVETLLLFAYMWVTSGVVALISIPITKYLANLTLIGTLLAFFVLGVATLLLLKRHSSRSSSKAKKERENEDQ